MKDKSNFTYFVAILVSIICFATGTGWCWTSPIIPQLETNDTTINPLDNALNTYQSGLMVSVFYAGLLFGPLLSGWATQIAGKKSSLLVGSIPLCLAHIICISYTSLHTLILARVFMGLTAGWIWAVSPGYIAEISSIENRGTLNSLTVVFYGFGSLSAYVFGPWLSLTYFSVINLIPVVLYLISGYLWMPESPYDLVMKGKLNDAAFSLRKLRRTSDIQKDLEDIQIMMQSSTNAGVFDIFKNSTARRTLFVVIPTFVFASLSGMIIILSYTQTILEMVGYSVSSATIPILVGIVIILGAIANCCIVDTFGRKPILIIAGLIVCFCHIGLSIFFFYPTPSGRWISVVCVIASVFAFHFSYSSIPYIILGEVFSPQFKTAAATGCTTICFGLSLIQSISYPFIVKSLGVEFMFIFYGTMMTLSVLFCVFKLPETKGMSLKEIHIILCNN